MGLNVNRAITLYLVAIIIGIIFKGALDSPILGLCVIATLPFIARKIGYPITEINNDKS